MAVKIGHSSKDENGKFAGGIAGDSTGKEVCTRTWYNGGWNVLLRPKTTALAERSAKACEAGCANSKIGYDQNQRNTLYNKAKAVGYDLSKIKDACECDCSAFMHVCAIAGGANIAYGSNGYTTRNIVAGLVNSGNYEKLTDSKYLTSDKYLMRGDILVKEGSHTVMVLSNGAYAAAKTEVKTQNNSSNTSKGENTVNISMSVLSRGSKGEQVKTLQRLLIALGYDLGEHGADGDFGGATYNAVCKFQEAKGLGVDGVVGKDTWTKLLKG